MSASNLQEVIESSEIVMHPGRYAYLRCAARLAGDHFLVAQDSDEVTVVTEESRVSEVAHSDSTRCFKVLEDRVSRPFTATGFLAKITQTVAEQGLNVLVVSTYSKDYILIREESADVVIDALKHVGFAVRAGQVE